MKFTQDVNEKLKFTQRSNHIQCHLIMKYVFILSIAANAKRNRLQRSVPLVVLFLAFEFFSFLYIH